MNTLFSHVCVVTMDERMSVWTDAFVGVTDGKISYLSKHAPEEKPAQIIDATGMVLMPGFINCHTHLPMQLLRGYADDLKLQEWLNDYIFPREDRLDGRCVRAATTLAVAECLKFGVTSVSDMYYFCDDICDVIAKSGMKANISRGTSPPVRSWSRSKTNGTILMAAESRSKRPSTPSIPPPISSGTHSPSLPSMKASACRCMCRKRNWSMSSASSAMG